MQDWSLHSDNTGGYFQCNRFVEQSSGGGAVNGPSRSADGADPLMGRGDIWSEERGNAHAEAMRSRERNRRMARFIHHFTRYKAHGDSQAMEVRMHKETLRRIGEGLRACVDGQLKWLQGTLVPNPVLSASAKQMNANAVPSTPLNRFASQKIVAKDYQLPPCDPCIEFLHHGFEELHRCRSFLQFSYVYAYFEFMDNDDYDVATGRRRSFYARMRVDDHRSSFEMLQADLESTIEMLSDVCARRRLRASESQIAQATRAAKQKRVEFESLLIAYSISKQQAAQEESSASSSMSPFRSAPLSELRMRAMGRANNRRTPRYPPQATAAFETMLRRANRDRDRHNDINLETIEEGLDEYSMDELANLLLELELVHASQASQAAPAPTPQEVPVAAPSQPAENDQEPEIATPGQTRANNPSTIRERLNAVFAPASTGGGQERRADSVDSAGAGDSPSLEYSNSNEESDDSSDQENVVIVTPQQRRSQQQRQQQEERRLLRLARRAEEAADLNRAILMSLQAPATRPQSSSNAPPNEEHIGTLMAMGFSREDAEAALRRAGNSLEAAVNQLLG